MSEVISVFPGSFDPITLGHINIIERLSKKFDKIVVLVAESRNKKPLFDSSERVLLARESLQHLKNVEVESYEGLTVKYLESKGAGFIIRGVRSGTDFDYETMIADMNNNLSPNIETLIVFSAPQYRSIASRIIKEIVYNGGNVSSMVSRPVLNALERKFK